MMKIFNIILSHRRSKQTTIFVIILVSSIVYFFSSINYSADSSSINNLAENLARHQNLYGLIENDKTGLTALQMDQIEKPNKEEIKRQKEEMEKKRKESQMKISEKKDIEQLAQKIRENRNNRRPRRTQRKKNKSKIEQSRKELELKEYLEKGDSASFFQSLPQNEKDALKREAEEIKNKKFGTLNQDSNIVMEKDFANSDKLVNNPKKLLKDRN